MNDTTKTEALRLAAWLLDNATHLNHAEAAAELRRLSSVEAERDHYKARCEALTDDALSRVMDASEDELNAALKLEGKDPDDTARLAGQAIELALLTAERDRLAAECEALRADAERWREARKGARCNSIDGAAWLDLGKYPWPLVSLPETADYADAAIDAAMGGKESHVPAQGSGS